MLSLGLGVTRARAPRAPAIAYLLDTLDATPTAAYSFRKLRAGYSGACLRARRSTDNAESDIAFDGDVVDAAALVTLAAGGTGYVARRYDQTGNGREIVMTSASFQPTIVQSGAAITLGGQLAMKCTGTQYFDMASAGRTGLLQGVPGGTMAAVFSTEDVVGSGTPMYISVSGVNADRHSIGLSAGKPRMTVRLGDAGSGAALESSVTLASGVPACVIAVGRYSEGQEDIYVNGVSDTGALLSSGSIPNTQPSQARFPRNSGLTGNMDLVLVFNTAISASDIAKIQAYCSSTYGV